MRLAGLWLLALAATLALLFLTARAYDYEQTSTKPRNGIGRALVCVGSSPGPVLCSYYGSRQKKTVRYYWTIGIL